MKQKGFTLVELLLVIAAMALVSTLSISFYSRFLLQNSVANTVDQFVGQLRKAQLYAMMGKQNNGWGINFSGSTITLFQGETFATRVAAFDEKFNVPSTVSVTGFTEIDYAQRTGLPSASSTITISGGGNTKTITVNTEGVVNRN